MPSNDQPAARIAELEAAILEIVDAGEALTRPGSAPQQHVNVVRMTNAVQAGAKLIGHKTGIFPEWSRG
jgi:hypothetical protein